MGFKKTSDIIAISFRVNETAANTYTQEQIALQLDVLNNEIFVVLAADLNPSQPELITGTPTEVQAAITSTTQATMANLDLSNTIAVASQSIATDALNAVPFTRTAEESVSSNISYISLIATNNFFVAVQGTGNTALKTLTGRLWGYRAKADGSTYAALVQSEVLSA